MGLMNKMMIIKDTWYMFQAYSMRNEIGKIIIPFTIIISDAEDAEKFEAKIFHDINFKQLPLRQETSLKIISELKTFDEGEKLGPEYPLALELIKKMDTGMFNDIHWLANNKDESQSYYRTTCLRLSQLLMSRKKIVESLLNDSIEKSKKNTEERNEKEEEIKKGLANQESDFVKLKQQKEDCESESDKYKNFISSASNPDVIVKKIQYLRRFYEDFENGEYGNIAMFVTMAYYSLLNKNQLHSFVNWVKRNGINKIVAADDLSTDASANLITMFEQIYKSKGNEIFISMKFNDSQSELIYEKIERAIETFNKKNRSIHLNPHPIRIDRTIEASTYSIQDKILYAIQSCSLIIADLSSANINVYHEIGYAMGVAKSQGQEPNMILLYKEDSDYIKPDMDIDKFVGFNLRNLSQLRFKDYKQLVDGLVERLEKHYGV